MSAQDELTTLQTNNAADATALTALEADLSTPATESVGDTFLAASVTALEAAGYTVTAPAAAPAADADASTETPAEDASEPSTETTA